jgi:hypothetical protein
MGTVTFCLTKKWIDVMNELVAWRFKPCEDAR